MSDETFSPKRDVPAPPGYLALGKYQVEGFDLREATFYTDSVSDLPLMLRVAEPIAVNPDPRLRRIALARSWRIERW